MPEPPRLLSNCPASACHMVPTNRVAVLAFVLLVLLTLTAAVTAWSHQQGIADLRHRHQTAADSAFDAQPNRHPHRVVHYGTFIFRPLAAFDPGVDAFTGNSMFLEGHRQNTANFGDVRQSSLLIRFGQLTPAFVLQAVAPLLLIFLGYGAIARERERGTRSAWRFRQFFSSRLLRPSHPKSQNSRTALCRSRDCRRPMIREL